MTACTPLQAGSLTPGGIGMVKREKVTDERGRRWVTGVLDSDTWFASVEREARRAAQRSLADRLARSNGQPHRPAHAH